MGRNIVENHEHGVFTCEWVDEVPPLGKDRKTVLEQYLDIILGDDTMQATRAGAWGSLSGRRGNVTCSICYPEIHSRPNSLVAVRL